MFSTTEITMMLLQSGAALEAVDEAMKPLDWTKPAFADGQKMDEMAKLKYLADEGYCHKFGWCEECPLHPCRAGSRREIVFLAKQKLAERAAEVWNG